MCWELLIKKSESVKDATVGVDIGSSGTAGVYLLHEAVIIWPYGLSASHWRAFRSSPHVNLESGESFELANK